MKHDATTLRTKKALAESLKNLMQSKPFSKITVSEITRDCGVNRKTFYYHFEDVYDLLKWMLEQEAIEVVKNFDLFVNLEEAITFANAAAAISVTRPGAQPSIPSRAETDAMLQGE